MVPEFDWLHRVHQERRKCADRNKYYASNRQRSSDPCERHQLVIIVALSWRVG